MMVRRKHVDPIPKELASYEEAAEFWDTHDTTDYPDSFRTVEAVVEFRRRRYEVEIDEDVARELRVKARQEGVTISHLASDLLRQQLPAAR
jgi:hypothetical protein